MDFWKRLCPNHSNRALPITLYSPAFVSLISQEMFPFHTQFLISLALWSSKQKVLCPNLLQWPHKVSQDLNHLWIVLSLLLLELLSAVSPVLSPTLYIFITLNNTQPQTLFADLNWNHVDFYSVMVATRQKLGTQRTSLDLDFACHLMLITSFSNGDITNLWNVSQLPATPNYRNTFLCNNLRTPVFKWNIT